MSTSETKSLTTIKSNHMAEKEITQWDKTHNVDIYILNNDVSTYLETYKSLEKKVIGIFHGVFLSCIFTNHTSLYQQWYRFDLFDSFVQIILYIKD